ncbi:hypothetical protein PG984_005297 [Apiospora sp. TS-2023a]
MRDLPLEIVDRIVDFLPGGGQADAPRKRTPEGEGCWPRLAPYATLSPQFLEAVQRRIWRSLDISNHHLEECARYLSNPLQGRPGCLRDLTFRVDLPVVEMAAWGRYEQLEETAAVSEEFGLHMRRLFDMLHSLDDQGDQIEKGGGGAHNIHLHLADVAHELPDDKSYVHRCCYDREPMTRYEFARKWRYDHVRITLPGIDSFPLVHCVRHLSFGEWCRRPDPSVQLMMAARMGPGLAAVDLVLDGNKGWTRRFSTRTAGA